MGSTMSKNRHGLAWLGHVQPHSHSWILLLLSLLCSKQQQGLESEEEKQ